MVIFPVVGILIVQLLVVKHVKLAAPPESLITPVLQFAVVFEPLKEVQRSLAAVHNRGAGAGVGIPDQRPVAGS